MATRVMRGLVTMLGLALLLAGLGGYIYYESKRPPAQESGPVVAKAFAIKPSDIEQLTVSAAGGETTTVVKQGDHWQITSPIDAKADGLAISAMTRALSGAEVQRVVDAAPSDLKQFGLDLPHVVVVARVSGQKDGVRLLLGDKTVTGSDMYAKTGADPKVFLSSASLDSTFNKSTFDLRDKTVVAVDRDAIDFVEVKAGDRIVQVTRTGTDWSMKQPLQLRADAGVVGDLLSKLVALQMKSVLPASASDLRKDGLDRPAYSVTIGNGSARSVLEIGGDGPESTLYARDPSRPIVFTIDRAIADDLKKDAWEFRRKDVFDFETVDATRLEITRGGHTSIFEKSSDAQGSWRKVSPTTRVVDATKLQAVLSKLSYLRAVGFVDPKHTKTGLDAPDISVMVKSDGGKKEEQVKLAKTAADSFAGRSDWPDAGRLDANAYKLLTAALDELAK
jgi:uncharacterized protein DUF4340